MPGITMPPAASISVVPVRDVERRADGRDPLAFDEDVRVAEHGPGGGHGQHGAVPEDDRCSRPDLHVGV